MSVLLLLGLGGGPWDMVPEELRRQAWLENRPILVYLYDST
jgi:hypothetical protein